MTRMIKPRALLCLIPLLGMLLVGCVQSRYQYGVRTEATYKRPVPPEDSDDLPDNVITYGGKYPRLDRLERQLHAPVKYVKSKLPRKKKRSDTTAEKSPEELREEALALSYAFLQDNQLDDVYIDVRRYEPGEQWKRLQANKRISPLAKYTGGTLSIVLYSLLPGRLFHNDSYNPYTNTLSLNSTRPLEALYESGSAKEYLRNEYLGLYSLAQLIPVVPVAHSVRVASDVNTYAHVHDMPETERQLYPYTYSKVAGTVVSEALSLYPVGTGIMRPVSSLALGFAGRKTGALVGQVAADNAVPTEATEDHAGASEDGSEDSSQPQRTRTAEQIISE